MRPLEYQRATNVEGAIAARGGDRGTAFLAGGTTLIDLVKLDVMQPKRLVDVSRLPLQMIESNPDGGVRIGANVRNSDLAWDDLIKTKYAALSQAVLSGASPQLRNMATTAGNVMQRVRCPYFRDNCSACNKRDPGSGCAAREGYNRMHAVLGGSESCVATHPSDMCVALAMLEAVVVVEGSHGERHIPIADFHLLPGETPDKEHALEPDELITAVLLPPLPENSKTMYLKVRDRASYEFALASVAVLVVQEGDRIRKAQVALGGVGTKPWRSAEAERVLKGEIVSDALFLRAAQAALEPARALRHNAFKIPLAIGVLRRALAELTDVR